MTFLVQNKFHRQNFILKNASTQSFLDVGIFKILLLLCPQFFRHLLHFKLDWLKIEAAESLHVGKKVHMGLVDLLCGLDAPGEDPQQVLVVHELHLDPEKEKDPPGE